MKDKVKRISAVIIIIILLLSIVTIVSYYSLENSCFELRAEKNDLETQLITTKNQLKETNSQLNISLLELEQVEKYLQENSSELELLKSGNNYELHDALYSEVDQFIEEDYSNDERTLIENAKNLGIRCAYVIVKVIGSTITPLSGTSSGVMHPLVGFNTVDEGMVYYESITGYRVYPKTGESYVDCVEGSPYQSDYMINDTIKGILVIW